jgi:aspartyl-tRNA(Asn)/glutamyl-tRNA(Gln) amidotransferase subunit A
MFSKLSKCKIVQVSLPHSIYSMSVYTILTSCEVASNFARYDGLKYGYHTKLSEFKKEDYEFEKVLTRNRDNSLGRTVKGRIVSGNFFLLKE